MPGAWPQFEGGGARTYECGSRFDPTNGSPKLGLDENMELLSRVLGVGDEDRDLSALRVALKTKLVLSDLKKPPPTMFPGVELLTRVVKSCRGIRSSPVDTCPSPFHPRVRTVPVCSVGDTTEAEMKGYGLSALAPWPQCTPHPSQVVQVTQVSQGGERRPLPRRTLRSNSPSSIPKTGLNGLRRFLSFCFSRVSNTLMSGLNARSSKSRAKRNSFSGRLRLPSGRAPTGGLLEKAGANVSSLQSGPECPNGD